MIKRNIKTLYENLILYFTQKLFLNENIHNYILIKVKSSNVFLNPFTI